MTRTALPSPSVGQLEVPVAGDDDEAVALHARDRLGDRRAGVPEPLGDAGAQGGDAFLGELVDRLEVHLRRVDQVAHCCSLPRRVIVARASAQGAGGRAVHRLVGRADSRGPRPPILGLVPDAHADHDPRAPAARGRPLRLRPVQGPRRPRSTRWPAPRRPCWAPRTARHPCARSSAACAPASPRCSTCPTATRSCWATAARRCSGTSPPCACRATARRSARSASSAPSSPPPRPARRSSASPWSPPPRPAAWRCRPSPTASTPTPGRTTRRRPASSHPCAGSPARASRARSCSSTARPAPAGWRSTWRRPTSTTSRRRSRSRPTAASGSPPPPPPRSSGPRASSRAAAGCRSPCRSPRR